LPGRSAGVFDAALNPRQKISTKKVERAAGALGETARSARRTLEGVHTSFRSSTVGSSERASRF